MKKQKHFFCLQLPRVERPPAESYNSHAGELIPTLAVSPEQAVNNAIYSTFNPIDETQFKLITKYLHEIHDSYEDIVANWKRTLVRYQEHTIVPPDADLIVLPAEIDMYEHPDYVHVAAGTIREKVRKMIAARRNA